MKISLVFGFERFFEFLSIRVLRFVCLWKRPVRGYLFLGERIFLVIGSGLDSMLRTNVVPTVGPLERSE